jgi:DNA-binding response OmpR family regulator
MQLLIVHEEPEIGEPLRRMVEEYSGHAAAFVPGESAALEWAEQSTECDLLITQLQSESVDGFTLAGR